jgi:hypothetical protein
MNWVNEPASESVVAMARVHALGMLLADAAAVVGIIVERLPIYAVIASVLGLLSFFIFVVELPRLLRLLNRLHTHLAS